MATRKFTKDHEYIILDGEHGTVGITSYAQEKLGDVTFVEMPEIGKMLHQQDAAGVVESVKAASEIYSPASGEVVEANGELAEHPERLNEDPEGAAWLFKLKLSDPAELGPLMDEAAYKAYVEGLD
jgi:glycine cleavage system H protein